LGTLRRNPDLKWRQTPQDLAELTVKQAAILARAAKLTKAGGRLIYSTCSLLSDENEQIAQAFLAAHPDFTLLNAAEILSQQQIALNTGSYLKLLPHLHHTDGFFAAVFEKTADTLVKKAPAPSAVSAEAPAVEKVPAPKKASTVKKATAVKKATTMAKAPVKTPAKAVKVKAAKA
jgi:16S rRNA (cytosine967-C5)-methyltransferase